MINYFVLTNEKHNINNIDIKNKKKFRSHSLLLKINEIEETFCSNRNNDEVKWIQA